MICYEEKMSEMYGLGRPCSGRSTETLRRFLSYYVWVPFELPHDVSRNPTGFSPWEECEQPNNFTKTT